ncbi:MAG: YdjY domain-containing protein [Planctomycetota bacterium]|nr:YdjY domain-containing protein [Planctomycetota bacterium]
MVRLLHGAASGFLVLFLMGTGVSQEPPAETPPPRKPAPIKGLFPGIEIDLERKQLTMKGSIAIPRGLIELFACTPYGKTHEAVCAVEVQPEHLKAALLLLGLKAKPQVNHLGERKALEGDRVKIWVVWEQDGMKKRYRAEKLIWDRSTNKPMENVGWVFTGSRFLKVPIYVADQEEPEEREVFMATEKGSLVTTYHDPDSILDNPLEMGGDDTVYYANDRLLPPRGTPIQFIIQAEKAAQKGSDPVNDDAKKSAPPPKKGEEGKK